MDNVDKSYEVGVIIGRFQVHELHEGHKKLIQDVIDQHKKVIIFLGISPVLLTRNNPLDYESRMKMIRETFPDVVITPIKDKNNNKLWSEELDRRIKEIYPIGNVLLYGGRDSFIPYYEGKFETTELVQEIFVSGTEVRKSVSEEVKSDINFRAGVIYASYNQYPKVFPTVDIVPVQLSEGKFLLARKPDEDKYRFIGGFVDPQDETYEAAAKRELREEAGSFEATGIRYVSSRLIDDWRYRKELDKIITNLYMIDYSYGRISPDDDISECRWFSVDDFVINPKEGGDHTLSPVTMERLIMPVHTGLFMDFFMKFQMELKEYSNTKSNEQ